MFPEDKMQPKHTVALLFALLALTTTAHATHVVFSRPFEKPIDGVVDTMTKDEVTVLVAHKLGHKAGEEELDVSKKTHKVEKRIFLRGDIKTIDGISVDLYEKLRDYSMFFKIRTLYAEQKFIFESGVGWFAQILVVAILLLGLMGLMPATLYFAAKIFNKTGDVSIAGAYVTHSLLLGIGLGSLPFEAWLIRTTEFFKTDTGILVYTLAYLFTGLVIVIARRTTSYSEAIMSYIGWFLGVPLTLWLITLSQPKLLDLVAK